MASDASTLARLLHAAAQQRRLMQPWLGDKRFVAKGGTLLYAVDADVIMLYVNPAERAVATEQGREGYAQVFPWDNDAVSEALGRALAEHIFFRMGDTRGLLLLPPTEQEVRRIFAALTHRAAGEHADVAGDLHRLEVLVSNLKQERSDEATLDWLTSNAPRLARFLAGQRGPSAEVRRFSRLLAQGRIAPLEFALEQSWVIHSTLRKALRGPELFKGRADLRKLRENWFLRLSGTKSTATSKVLIYDDAQALARLEWTNAHLNQRRYRLVLITGDPSLLDAARYYVPDSQGETHSFADLYLRHPRAYLAEPAVLSPKKGTPKATVSVDTEFLKWLDTFLGELQVGGQSYRERLDEVLVKLEAQDAELTASVHQVLQRHPTIVEEVHQRWTDYTRNLVLDHGLPVSSGEAEIKVVAQLRDGVKAALERVSRQIARRVRETWAACFEVATQAGLGWLQASLGPVRARNVPLLSFHSFPKASQFVHAMLSSSPRGVSRKIYDKKFDALRQEDPSMYTFYVAHSLLFAAAGSWRVAAILAERAWDIAQAHQRKPITGREAAYLWAVALRHSAKHTADLARVSLLLQQANVCFAVDREERPEVEGGEIRFEAERLALWVTYHLFQRFLGEKLPDVVPTLAQVQDEIIALLQEKVVAMLERLDEHHQERRLIARIVERNLLTNLFTIALLRWDQGESLDPIKLRPLFARYDTNLRSSERPPIEPSFLVQSIYLAAGFCTASDDQEKEHLRQRLSNELTETNIVAHTVFPYDPGRFLFLRNLVSPGGVSKGAS